MGVLTFLLEFFLLGFGALFLYIIYVHHKHKKYFQEKGMPYTGTGLYRVIRFLQGKLSLPEAELMVYQNARDTNRPFTGYTDAFTNPAVFVIDLDLAKHIYVKDFDNFVNRRNLTNPKGEPLFQKVLFMMENEPWKAMRTKLSPSFTTGKIRRMFDIFNRSSLRMSDYLRRAVGPSGRDYDLCEIHSKYTMDVIASCVFGVDSKSFDCDLGKQSEFEGMGQRLQFKFKAANFIRFLVTMAAPKVAQLLGLKVTDQVPQEYFKKVVQQVLKHRRATGERQEDFLQLMMDIQKGLLKAEDGKDSKEILEVMTGSDETKSWSHHGDAASKLHFDDEDIAANCVLFLFAGFDMLNSVLTYTCYTLAREQEVQKKLREEVNKSMKANQGKLTYEEVHEMKYLDMFLNEILRMYPPNARNERVCTKDYLIPGTSSVIEKGTIVSLPILGIHRDPRHYENPDKFDPLRFLPQNKSNRHPLAFAPFGHGPRNCIGMRFSLTEAKTAICSLVKDFQFEPCSKTEISPKFANSASLKPKNGMWLRIRPISAE